ncbi:hypothetical protein LX32DRAFT_101817 [Colletotrichum zoysiae]|uniref:Uncharacterized protein n=1 Tax=Colletotrichum zoysiae TaxID=1216348 RepID=A0AAD9M092_9PEZI|nr:hypothetical protein LX32DRAFT_101817 [Colletotrichum zoysiae]
MDSTQEKLLRSRKRTDKHMSEADKWNKMYTILFPDAEPNCIPSLCRLSSFQIDCFPAHRTTDYEYLGSGLSVNGSPETEFWRYEQFLRRELPSEVQRQLELRIEECLNPIEEILRNDLVNIVRDTQIQLFNTYRRSLRSSAPATSSGEPVQNTSADTERVAGVAEITEDSHQVYDDLHTSPQPLSMDNVESFDDFNGLLFDFPEMPPGSIDLDFGYWSVAPDIGKDKDENELDFLSGEFNG